ncbi:MAG: RNA polymerase sigma factor [Phocaeicola sp.]|uniref:RNA polymerase sigma factor n=2 Tax=Bacteroidaceae TaxID=815 RepID=UPI00234FB196|nr:sigma-70 family RNA polymerase sigma factor [Phocaeicola oris]
MKIKRQMKISEKESLSLFRQSIKGDRYALEFLYKDNYDLLYNYGLKYSPDEDLVKDCIQDLFINIFYNSHIKIEHVVSARSYLLKALRNNLIYKILSEKNVSSLEDLEFNVPIDENLFDRMFPKSDEETLLAKKLIQAIGQLSSNQKSVLYLRYVKGFSHNEVAEVMNINPQSSMNLLNRALSKLRDVMDKTGGDVFYLTVVFCTILKFLIK